MGNFRRMKAGEPWSVTEPTARAIIESAEYWAQHNNDPGDVDSPDYLFEGTIVQVRNDSGTAQNRFSVMGLAGALINDQQNLQEFKNYPRFSVVTPSTSSSGTGARPSAAASLMRNRPRIVSSFSSCSFRISA